jgi:hypothetical protein
VWRIKMNKAFIGALIAGAMCFSATAAQAMVHYVYPGESIQAAIDMAVPGDSIIVEPGVYKEKSNKTYGLRIYRNDIRLIGKTRKKKGQGRTNRVRLLQHKNQETGVYAAPDGCDYDMNADDKLNPDGSVKQEGCKTVLGIEGDGPVPIENYIKNFYIRGFSVEGFPVNGIQTRWVDGFQFVSNGSVNNLNNGIYPTLSANGMVRNNVSYGSLDTAMWIAGSENVRVIGNELHGSVIGFEITVSNKVHVEANKIYDNTVGVGLFHPNGAGNPPLDEMVDWVITQNDIYDNNRDNEAPENTFQSVLPSGIGVLLSGVSDHEVSYNDVSGNNYVGIALLGWCTGLGIPPPPDGCLVEELGGDLKASPGSTNNLVAENYLFGNGKMPPDDAELPPADLLYAQVIEEAVPFYSTAGNCFRDNEPEDDLVTFNLFYVPGEEDPGVSTELPTDGC